MTKKASFSEPVYASKKRRYRFLAEIESVKPWAVLEETIAPFYPSSRGRGQPLIDFGGMLRMYIAQQCFGLSDEGVVLDHVKRMIDLGPDAGLGMLDLFKQITQRRARQLAFAGPHGGVPSDRQFKTLFPFFDALVARIPKGIGFVTVQ